MEGGRLGSMGWLSVTCLGWGCPSLASPRKLQEVLSLLDVFHIKRNVFWCILASTFLAGKQTISCWIYISEWNIILCLSTEKNLQRSQFSILPSFLSLSLFPVFIVNDTQSGFILKNFAWQRPIWSDMYCPQEALPLTVDCEKRHLVSFKWRQQYFRLPDQGRFYTVEVGTDCVKNKMQTWVCCAYA